MPEFFANNEQYQKLSPEAQKIVYERFNSMSPEAQDIVRSKMGGTAEETPKEDPRIGELSAELSRLEKSGVSPDATVGIKAKIDALKKGIPNEKQSFFIQDHPFDTTGENIAKSLAEKGHDPRLSAAVGTAFAMIPDLIMSIPGGKGAKVGTEVAEQGIKAVGETTLGSALRGTGRKAVEEVSEKLAETELRQSGQINKLKTAGETIANMASKTKEAVVQSAERPVAAMKQEIADLPLKQTAIKEAATKTMKAAGAKIGEAEKALEIGLKNTSVSAMQRITSSSAKLAKFADRASRLADKGAEKLSAMADPETLQFYRKTAQEGIKKGSSLGEAARVKLFQVNKTFGDALGMADKGFGEAMGEYKNARTVVDKLPAEFKSQKQSLQAGIVKLKELAKDKVMTDAKLKRIEQVNAFMETKIKQIPRQFDEEKKALKLALQKAHNLASKQAPIRKIAGWTGVGAATALGAGMIRKLKG